MKDTLLYFGSFNPVHRGHIALAEYALRQKLCDRVVLVVSPHNPFKDAEMLAPELDRFEMAEIACRASAFPERIIPSAVEFLLPKPSYTIDTLRYLREQHGADDRFSVLMGADQLRDFARWKEADALLSEFRVVVYPRAGAPLGDYAGRVVYLADAPLYDDSSTRVREALERGDDASAMLDAGVLAYIREKGLWSPEKYLARLDQRIEAEPDDVALLVERGKFHYRRNEWGKALNDFNRVRRADPACAEAEEFARMVEEILTFRYTDLYNP